MPLNTQVLILATVFSVTLAAPFYCSAKELDKQAWWLCGYFFLTQIGLTTTVPSKRSIGPFEPINICQGSSVHSPALETEDQAAQVKWTLSIRLAAWPCNIRQHFEICVPHREGRRKMWATWGRPCLFPASHDGDSDLGLSCHMLR